VRASAVDNGIHIKRIRVAKVVFMESSGVKSAAQMSDTLRPTWEQQAKTANQFRNSMKDLEVIPARTR
jgi:hypothetical protein